MSEQYHIVPWFNSKEWHSVYNYIYSENRNKKDALDVLQVWKARCPALPSGIESTLSLLQVHFQDEKSVIDVENDQILRLAYSSALMRFVNHMLDTETAKGTSLYIAAKNAGVPEWIVDLRHEAAHSNSLPSLVLLRNACLISLEWLQKNYWDKHKMCIQDYTLGQKETFSSVDKSLIASLIHICSCLSICSHSKIKNLADIKDADMQESIVNDIQDLFGDLIDLSNLKTVSIARLITMTDIHAKKTLQHGDATSFVNKALLGKESLVLSLDLVEYLSKNDFNNKQLSRSYVMCFKVLLTFLHTNDLIFDFILALVKLTQGQDDDCSKKNLLAALWLSEILAALKKSNQFVERVNKMNSKGGTPKKKKDLKALYHHWFPNEKLDGLVLDLQKPAPSKLSDINTIQPIITSYNTYLTYFVRDLLNLVEPNLPYQVCEKICMLAGLISAPEKYPLQPFQKIYTIDDLKSEESVMDESPLDATYIDAQGIDTIWKDAEKNHNWGSCPIGKVPWQQESLDIEIE